jgi:hypothetical protein
MNIFAEMFRSKASSAAPLSPGRDERSTFESLILQYRRIMTQSSGRGRGGGRRRAIAALATARRAFVFVHETYLGFKF